MLVLLIFGGGGGGGVVQNRESPDFRSPEVGRYATGLAQQKLRSGWTWDKKGKGS